MRPLIDCQLQTVMWAAFFYIIIISTPRVTLSVFHVSRCTSGARLASISPLRCCSHLLQDLDFVFSLRRNQKCLRLFQHTRLSPTSFIILSLPHPPPPACTSPPHPPHPSFLQLSHSLLPTSFLLSLSRLNFIDASSLKEGECEFQSLSHCVWPLLSR